MVPVVSRIFYVSSSTGLGIEGYLTCWKDELGNHTLGTKAQNMDQLRFFGLNNKPSTSCHWFLCFGTRPRHQTRAPCLGPPRLMKGSYALARSRGYTTGTIFIQGPSIVQPVWRSFMFNGSYALALGRDTKPRHHALVHPDSRRENLIFCTNHIPRNETSKYAPTESFWGSI